MTPTQNIFPGINPYLNCQLLTRGGWQGFQTAHIADMMKTLRAALIPMGYTAELQAGLQVRRLGEPVRARRPDVVILDTGERAAAQPAPTTTVTQHVQIPLAELLNDTDESDQFMALAVYEIGSDDAQPVAWLELLSPSNKPPRPDHEAYARKRQEVLDAGIVFVELDYIHTQPPTFPRLVDYTRNEQGAPPYRILVMAPHQPKTQVSLYPFGVLDAIPTVEIPLSGDDKLVFSFGVPYTKTF